MMDAEVHDPPTTTVHVPEPVADDLLRLAGIRRIEDPTSITGPRRLRDPHDRRRGAVLYVLPEGRPRSEGGKFGVDYLWMRDEALTRALDLIARR